jgi:hypothetical protein
MQTVFNAPMTSDSVGKGVHRGETEQKVAGFSAHLLLDAPFGSHHANGSQAFPLLVRVQIVQNRGIANGPVFPDFQPPMPLLHSASRLCLHVGKRFFLGQSKCRLDLFLQIPLVVLERQGIRSLLLDDLLGDLGLCSHRINGHDTSSKR